MAKRVIKAHPKTRNRLNTAPNHADNQAMSKLRLILPAVLLVAACAPAPVSVIKPESQKLHNGMQPAEVQAICGKPTQSFTDPLSGSAMWDYKDEKVGDHMIVMFNMDGVARVTYSASS